MATISIEGNQLETIIEKNEIVFIDFWAPWCAPCKQFSKNFERVALETADMTFATMNIENESVLAEFLEIRSIPHLMVFKRGVLIYSESGSLPESSLRELVAQARSADVSELNEQTKE